MLKPVGFPYKYRAKGLTQEQVANNLNVNTQTVSRWECGTTLPDVLTLPELARLYEVTVDDFYKKNSVAYDNHAQYLASVFQDTEVKTKSKNKPEAV